MTKNPRFVSLPRKTKVGDLVRSGAFGSRIRYCVETKMHMFYGTCRYKGACPCGSALCSPVADHRWGVLKSALRVVPASVMNNKYQTTRTIWVRERWWYPVILAEQLTPEAWAMRQEMIRIHRRHNVGEATEKQVKEIEKRFLELVE